MCSFCYLTVGEGMHVHVAISMSILRMRLHKIHIYVLYGNIHKIWHQAKGGRGRHIMVVRGWKAFATEYHVWNGAQGGQKGAEG